MKDFHPLAALFPLRSDDHPEFIGLVESIKKNGLIDEITTLDGAILEGRHRYRACILAGKEPRYKEYEGTDPLEFVRAKNMDRRHMTENEKAFFASDYATLSRGGDKQSAGYKSYLSNGQIAFAPPKSRVEAAAAFGVSPTDLDRARKTKRRGTPELVAAVKSGEVSLRAGQTIAGLHPDEQREILALAPDAIRKKSAALRRAAPSAETPEKQALPPPPTAKKRRTPSYAPDRARELWALARTQLDMIQPTDKSREAVLNDVIAYVQNRFTTNT